MLITVHAPIYPHVHGTRPFKNRQRRNVGLWFIDYDNRAGSPFGKLLFSSYLSKSLKRE